MKIRSNFNFHSVLRDQQMCISNITYFIGIMHASLKNTHSSI